MCLIFTVHDHTKVVEIVESSTKKYEQRDLSTFYKIFTMHDVIKVVT